MIHFKKKLLSRILFIIVLCATPTRVFATDVEFIGKTSHTKVHPRDVITLTLTIKSKGRVHISPILLPNLSGFRTEGRSTSTSTVIINRSFQKTKKYSYHLRVTKQGRLKIPKITSVINNKKYTVGPFFILSHANNKPIPKKIHPYKTQPNKHKIKPGTQMSL